MKEITKKFKRKFDGVVISDSPEKTVIVNVLRRFKHRKYSKFVNQTKRYHAHDESSSAKLGDQVTIIESKQHSKMKRWELLSVNK